MSLWTAADIAAATGGTATGEFAVSGVTFDSREVEPGHLFVAMPGEVTDGHRFVEGAFDKGAAGALVSRPVAGPHVLVPEVPQALEALAAAARRRMAGKVAGVTGSVGKTGTKEALAAALARKPGTRVHRSVKSYNNHTGVPLSLARMPADTQYGVFEMGMNHAGEIRALTAQVRPHVALITAIAPAHIENLGSLEAIADAKAEIFEGLEPGGVAIIPFDSPYCDRLRAAAERHAGRVVTFGLGRGADVRAREVVPGDGLTLVSALLPDAELTFTVGQPGEHWVSNALAVLAAVQALDADLALAGLALAELQGLAGRGRRLRVPVGDGEALLIDESYNANATSMAATLAVLGQENGRKLAVLGEMRELGEHGPALHAGLAEPLLAAGVSRAILVGKGMGPLAERLEGAVEFDHVADAAAAADLVRQILRAGDALLIKGSNGVGLGRLVAALEPS